LTEDERISILSVIYRSVVVYEDARRGALSEYLARLDDKKDAHVWAAFEKLKCDILVTGDKELLRKVPKVKTTRQALEMLLGIG
jgi:predicted nucleic acid-binding protein